jgi:hypothetical protein
MDTEHAGDRVTAAMPGIGQILDDYRQTPHTRAEWFALADLLVAHARTLDRLGTEIRSAAKAKPNR